MVSVNRALFINTAAHAAYIGEMVSVNRALFI